MTSIVTSESVQTIGSVGLSDALGLAVVVVLLVLLVTKELLVGATDIRARRVGQLLSVATLPLLLAFGLIAVTKIAGLVH